MREAHRVTGRYERGLMRIRSWPIQAKIFALVVPPIVALTGYWVIGTTVSAAGSINLLNAGVADTNVVTPGQALVTELQGERRLSALWLATGPSSGTAGNGGQPSTGDALIEQRTRTDAAAATFRMLATDPDTAEAISEMAGQRLAEAVTALDALPAARTAVDRRERADRTATEGYDAAIDGILHAFLPLADLDDPESARLRRAVTDLRFAQEL